MKVFDHERLEVYQTAIRFVVLANDVVEQLPRGRGYLADQLQRAATSAVLNVAEGAGEFARKEKARFYRMARRSATECKSLRLLTDEKHAAGRDLLLQVVSMLVRMITNLGGEEGKGRGRGRGREE